MDKGNIGSVCTSYCACIGMPLSKEQRKILVKEYKQRSEDIEKKLARLKVRISGRVFVGVPRGSKDSPELTIMSIRLEPDPRKPPNEAGFKKVFSIAQPFADLANQFTQKDFDGRSCIHLRYDPNIFEPHGSLSIPQDLTLAPNIRGRVGSSQLSGFSLTFKESPLGLDRVAMLHLYDDLRVEIDSHHRHDSTAQLLLRIYEHVLNVAELFVRRRK